MKRDSINMMTIKFYDTKKQIARLRFLAEKIDCWINGSMKLLGEIIKM